MATYYPCSSASLAIHHQKKFPTRNRGPFLSSNEATSLLMTHNTSSRTVPRYEADAIDRLCDAVIDFEDGYRYGPDLAIKCFQDLDTVFFAGRLSGNVKVSWFNCCRKHSTDEGRNSYGFTKYPRRNERGQTRIKLNMRSLFSEGGRGNKEPFQMMFCTLLHEMCHAWDIVVSEANAGHDKHFETRISVVDESAVQILGLEAIHEWEPYMRHHEFRDLVDEDERFGGCGCGCRECREEESMETFRGSKGGRSGRKENGRGRKGRNWKVGWKWSSKR